jgi:hypothetical protein
MEKSNIKVIYKKPQIYQTNESLEVLKATITEKIKTYIENYTNDKTIDYMSIYKLIYILSEKNPKELIPIYDSVLEALKEKVNSLLAFDISDGNDISKFIKNYHYAQGLIDSVNFILINNTTRFNKDFILKQGTTLSSKAIMLESIRNTDILNNIKGIILSSNDETYILDLIHFITDIGAKEVYNSLIEIKQNQLADEYQKQSCVVLGSVDEYVDYLNGYNNKIQEEFFKFRVYFGEHNAYKLKERLVGILFLDKINEILTNKSVMDALILNKNFSILNLIYKLMNSKNENLVFFQDRLFECFVNRFYEDVKLPSNIKEGYLYIDFLLSRIDVLTETYNIAFNKDRRIQIRYKEAITRIINNKKVKNISLLCGLYINEIAVTNYQNVDEFKNHINKLQVVLQSLDEKETFFSVCQRYLIKRLSTFRFNYDNELFLVAILKEIFGVRYCFAIFRILNDIRESKAFFKDSLAGDNQVHLFSFNGLSSNDVASVLTNVYLDNVLNEAKGLYEQQYPHRKVTLSEQLSTVVLDYKANGATYSLLVNYIQSAILLYFNKTKTSSLGDLVKALNVKNIPIFRSNLLHLVQSGLLSVKDKPSDIRDSDIITINRDYESNKTLVNLTNIHTDSSTHKKEKEHNELENISTSTESLATIYKTNQLHILDCKLIKLIKSNKSIDLQTLVKAMLLESKAYFEANPGLIHKRLDNLIEKGLVFRRIEDDKVIFEYFEK